LIDDLTVLLNGHFYASQTGATIESIISNARKKGRELDRTAPLVQCNLEKRYLQALEASVES
jgi:hypothetical protein